MSNTFNLKDKLSKMLAPPYDPKAQPIDYLNYYEANNLEAIYIFNKKYNDYVTQCAGNGENPAPGTVCDNQVKELEAYAATINESSTNVSAMFQTFKQLKTSNSIPDALKSQAEQYSTDQHSTIMDKYGKVTTTRNDLDQKLKELYDIPGSKSLDYKYNYDSTIYSGILITIVASAVIYFSFTKL
jgi:hypothetical protein